MRRLELLRTGAFRLALGFALAYALSAFALVWVVDSAVVHYARHTAALTLLEESAALRQDDRQLGRAALLKEIAARTPATRAHPFVYLLLAGDGRKLAGTLDPEDARRGWSAVKTTEPDRPGDPGDGPAAAETFGARLGDGALLVVGRETFDVQELSEQLRRMTLWSGIGVAGLALLASFGVASVFLRRLERVNDAVQRIAEGGHTERLPAIRMGAEFDRLSANVNVMLDRITALMASMRQVSTDIAHDLRTPLTRLRQRLEATRGAASLGDYEAAVDDAIGQVDGLLATFRALLRIGMIEGGAGRSRFTGVDLSDVMERVRLAYQPAAEDRGMNLAGEVEPGARVMGDAELLTQVFANLLENALAHTPVGTCIVLSLHIDGDRAVAVVADNGPGIPADQREKVLARFYTLDESRSDGGSGLGLSLVSAIAALHQGVLTLDDNGPGLRVALILAIARSR